MESTLLEQPLLRDPNQNLPKIPEHLETILFADEELSLIISKKSTFSDLTYPSKVRQDLVSWIFQFCERVQDEQQQVKFFAVLLADVFLASEMVDNSKVQLVGATCLFISIKCWKRCDEILLLEICNSGQGLYSRKMIYETEPVILKAIEKKISFQSPRKIVETLLFEISHLALFLDKAKICEDSNKYLDILLQTFPLADFTPLCLALATLMFILEVDQNRKDLFGKLIESLYLYDRFQNFLEKNWKKISQLCESFCLKRSENAMEIEEPLSMNEILAQNDYFEEGRRQLNEEIASHHPPQFSQPEQNPFGLHSPDSTAPSEIEYDEMFLECSEQLIDVIGPNDIFPRRNFHFEG